MFTPTSETLTLMYPGSLGGANWGGGAMLGDSSVMLVNVNNVAFTGRLLPTPAVLGVFLWSTMGAYVVLPTSAICGVLLPIAYIGWLVLNNRDDYLGADRPVGGRRLAYNGAMALCIVTVIASVTYSTSVGLGLIG